MDPNTILLAAAKHALCELKGYRHDGEQFTEPARTSEILLEAAIEIVERPCHRHCFVPKWLRNPLAEAEGEP